MTFIQKIKIAVVVTVLLAGIKPAVAQRNTHEGGVFLGYANYAGDLSPFPVAFTEFHRDYGLFYRYEYQHVQSIRVAFNYTTISGSDQNSAKETHRVRNLNFESKIYELAVTGEYNIYEFYPCNGQIFTPYLFGGIAGFHFKPTPKGGGPSLQKMGTEGQGLPGYSKPYLLYQVSFPLGVGAKWSVHRYLVFGVELNFRKTFTDYLDDVSKKYVPYETMVSQRGAEVAALADHSKGFVLSSANSQSLIRGNQKMKDWYGSAGVYLSYIFNSRCKNVRTRYVPRRYTFQCPRF